MSKEYTIDQFLKEIEGSSNAPVYEEMFKLERPNHSIVKVSKEPRGWRWKTDPVIQLIHEKDALNLNALFANGADKNDPVVRKLYRQMGYSIFGYWEIFHWNENNPKARKYKHKEV